MIQRKLERLGDGDRRLLAAAAVQGPEFDSAVVAGGLQLDAAEVEERLQSLDRVHGLVRLVREYELPDRTMTPRYAFVHVLYQQVLYTDLSPTRRATLGAALARVLEGHHGEGNPGIAAELACLYEVARDFARAARQFWLAAQNAARLFAHRDAVVLARRGLWLLGSLPPTPERAALELPLQMTLGLQLQVTDGYADPAAKQAYTRARDLCPLVPEPAPRFPVLWGLWLFHKVRSELSRAQELANELEALAQGQNDPALALQAHQALGMTALCRGEPAATLHHVERVAALYDPVRHRAHASQFGQDPGVICQAFGAVALWLLGYPDAAQRQSEAALLTSRDLSPSSQAVALHFASMVHQLRRDHRKTLEFAEEAAALAAEQGFAFWRAGAAVMSGWALAVSGQGEEGTRRLRQGLRDWQATGSGTYQTYYLGMLAEALAAQGMRDEGVHAVNEALALARQTEEGLIEAELFRLRGEVQANDESEADFRRALDLARRQGARSLGLRAAMSLVRLDRRRGTPGRSKVLLAEYISGFTEGLQTLDLREAAGLLEGA